MPLLINISCIYSLHFLISITGKQYPWDFLIQGKISTTPLRVLFDADLVAPADVVESDTDSDNGIL